MVMSADRIRELIRQQFAIAAELTELTGRPFTLDGHMVGSAGEVLARLRFGLELTDPSTKGIDATAPDGRSVEIKATGGARGVALRGDRPLADHLLVLTISADGQEAVVYNGPAAPVWAAIKRKSDQSNGQRMISLAWLRELQQTVLAEQMLPCPEHPQP
jgi:hypothetical protein